MSHAARTKAAADSQPAASAPAASRRQKFAVFLITQDESLWPLLGSGLGSEWTLKQLDTIEELTATASAGQSGIVVWDARSAADHSAELSRLQMHSERFVIVAIDAASKSGPWRAAIQQRRVVALLGMPFTSEQWHEILSSAREECLARAAVLGEAGARTAASAPPGVPGRRGFTRFAVWIAAAVCAAGGAGYWLYRGSEHHEPAAPRAVDASGARTGVAAAKPPPAADEQADALLERARRAMLERHFIEPAGGNALDYYKNVLLLDPGNGEARQGLERLANILFARAESDLNDRKFDMALQALETARSISPKDPRLTDLDARVEAMRTEIGPTQIQAALNAGNFDRATALIDESLRAKSLSAAQAAQWREDILKRREKADAGRLVKLMATRVQQDRLVEPRSDSAIYYLQEARQAGAGASDLKEQTDALNAKLLRFARSSLDEHRLADADRLLDAARSAGAAPDAIAALQRDLDGARDGQAREKIMQAQSLELARARLAGGQLVEPESDSALYYVNQLRTAAPSSPEWGPIAAALQSAIVARARTALDSGDAAQAESLAKAAESLGATPEVSELKDALARQAVKPSIEETVAVKSLVVVNPLKLDYPAAALAGGVEGWVDLAFDVTAAGKVANVTIVNSMPKKIFDSAAKNAMSRVRFQPVMKNGQATPVKSTLHVVFRLSPS